MADEDTVLRVGVEADISSFKTNMTEGSAVVAEATAQMNARFQALSARETELQNRTVLLGAEYEKLKAAQVPIQQLDVVQNLLNKTQQEAVVIEQQLTAEKLLGVQASDMAAAARKLEIDATNQARSAMQEHRSEVMEARHAMMMLGHETGVMLPRHVTSFLASLGPVAGIMAAAFTPIMLAGLIVALAEKVPEALKKAMEKLIEWTSGVHESAEAMQKNVDKTEQFINKIKELDVTIAGVGKIKDVQLIEKLGLDAEKLARTNVELNQIQTAVTKLNTEIKLGGGESSGFWTDFGSGIAKMMNTQLQLITGNTNAISTYKSAVTSLQKAAFAPTREESGTIGKEQLAAQQKRIEEERKVTELITQLNEQDVTSSIAANTAIIESQYTSAKSRIDSEKSVNEQRLKLGTITVEQYNATMKSIASQELSADTERLSKKRELLNQEEKLNMDAAVRSVNEIKATNKKRLDEQQITQKQYNDLEDGLDVGLLAIHKNYAAKRTELDKDITSAHAKFNSEIVSDDTKAIESRKSLELSLIENSKKVADARLALEKELNDSLLRLGVISKEQKYALDRAEEEKSYTQLMSYIARQKAAMETVAGGKAPAVGSTDYDKYQSLLTQEETATIEHQKNILKIDTESGESGFKQMEELGKRRIELDKEITTSRIAYEETADKQLYSEHQISAATLTSRELTDAKERYDAERSALTQTRTLRKQMNDWTVTDEQDTEAKLKILEINYEREKATIQSTGIRNVRADETERLSIAKTSADQRLEIDKENADQRLSIGQISRSRWAADEKAALDRWLMDEKAALNAYLTAMEQEGLQETREYARKLQELSALDIKYQKQKEGILVKEMEDWKHLLDQMGQGLTTGINSWIQGQKTFAQAMAQTWNSIVMTVVEAVERYVAKFISSQALMTSAEKIFHLQSNATQTTADTAKIASATKTNTSLITGETAVQSARRVLSLQDVQMTTTANTAKSKLTSVSNSAIMDSDAGVYSARAFLVADDAVMTTDNNADKLADVMATNFLIGMSDAAIAAAAAFSSVMQTLPWPANMAVAPGVAAGVYAEGVGLASLAVFAKGGVADEDMIAHVEKREMMLPPHIADWVQNAAQGGSKNVMQRPTTVHVHSNPTIIGGNDFIKQQIKEANREMVQLIHRAMRNNQLPSYP